MLCNLADQGVAILDAAAGDWHCAFERLDAKGSSLGPRQVGIPPTRVSQPCSPPEPERPRALRPHRPRGRRRCVRRDDGECEKCRLTKRV